MIWLGVALAGAAGAVCRFLVDTTITARTAKAYPWGTTVVNVTGALLVGLVTGAVAERGAPSDLATIVGSGFCGAYTTFSTLVHEVWRLARVGDRSRAAAHLATLLLALPAAAAGWALAAA